MNPILRYIQQNAIAIDQVLNTILGGWADETLSSRAWRADQDKRFFGRIFRPLIDGLFLVFGFPNHCQSAYLAEWRRYQLPPELR